MMQKVKLTLDEANSKLYGAYCEADAQAALRGEAVPDRKKSRKQRRAEDAINKRVVNEFVRKAVFRTKRKLDKGEK